MLRNKNLFCIVFALLICINFVSAADLITVAKGPVLSETNSQTYFDVRANSNIIFSMTTPFLQISDGKNHYLTLTLDSLSLTTYSLNSGQTQRITTNVVVDPAFVFDIKTYTFPDITLLATDSANTSIIEAEKVSLNFLKTFCKYGEKGTDLSISDIELNNHDNHDGNDNKWMPLNEISVEVEVSNNGNNRVEDVAVELGLYDSSGKNIVEDLLNLDNKKIILGTISDGNDKTATFTFKVPVDFKDLTYKLVLKAYSEDVGENTLCVSQSYVLSNTYYESISGKREDIEEKQITFTNIKINPSPAACQDKVQILADVVNVGDTDYADQIKVTLFNEDLGINLEQIIRKDFDEGDSYAINFEFDVPATAVEKIYALQFRVYYDFDAEDDEYKIASEKLIKTISIQGNCEQPAENTNARITAELDPETPEVIAGKQIIINANLKNTGTVETTYTVSVYENSAWSRLVSLSPKTITLAPGDSRDIKIVLDLNNDAEGDKEFTIKAVYGSKTTEQKVVISIEKPKLEIEILNPSNNSVLKGNFAGLSVKTNKNAVCKYSLSHSVNVKIPECEEGKPCSSGSGGGMVSAPKEMKITGGTEHSQLINNLHDTINNETIEENYKIIVSCTDETGYSDTTSTIFDINLSGVKEFLILENIEDYKYIMSSMFEFSEMNEKFDVYSAFYNKTEGNRFYITAIFDFKTNSLKEEFLKEIEDDEEFIVRPIGDYKVYIFTEDDMKMIIWPHNNLLIFIMEIPNIEDADEIEDFEPTNMELLPLPLIEKYLEKYPSDLMINQPEYVPPTIQIISPLDDYSTKSKSINFKYIPNDNSDITKCELIIDGQVKETDTTIIKDSENNFDLALSTGNYKWKIKCTDSHGNQGFSDEWDLEIKKSSSGRQSYSYSNYEPPSEIKTETEEPLLNEFSNEILKEPEIIRLESLKITGEKNNVIGVNKNIIFIGFVVFVLALFALFLIVLIIKRLR